MTPLYFVLYCSFVLVIDTQLVIYCYNLPQQSYGKVMFLHLSVILFTGGSLSRRGSLPGRPPITIRFGYMQAECILLECLLVLYDKWCLPPANKVWGKVMFLHLSVILFTGGAGYDVTSCYGQHHPPGQYHPLSLAAPPNQHPSGQQPLDSTTPP